MSKIIHSKLTDVWQYNSNLKGRNRRAIQVELVEKDCIEDDVETYSAGGALGLDEQPTNTDEHIEDLTAKFLREATRSHMKKYFKRRPKSEKVPPINESAKPKRRRVRRKVRDISPKAHK